MEDQNETISDGDFVVKESSKTPLYSFLVVLVILLVVGFMNFKGKDIKVVEESTPKTEVTSAPTPTATVTPTDVVNGEIAVEAGSFYYKPNLIRVKKGEKVKLTLNAVSMMHDFNIDELSVKVPITRDGTSSTVEFTPTKAGEFEFYCSVGNHRAMGQVGKLIVTE